MKKFIATYVSDTPEKMRQMAEAQKSKRGFGMDPYFYRSHITYKKELDSILYKSWLYAAHVSQVPNPGDFIQYELGEDAIIISRDQDGEIHAQYNICRHRGSRVCEEKSGNTRTFVCPYHGWVYNLDGSLRAAREMVALEDFNAADYGLKKPQICVFHGLIYINCNPDAAQLAPDLLVIEPAIRGYDLANAKVIESRVYRVDANWKLALENYLECYHCATAHRSYAKSHTLKEPYENVKELNEAMLARAEDQTGVAGVATEVRRIFNDNPHHGGGAYTSRYALYDGYLTGSQDGQPVAPLMGEYKGYDGGAGDYQIGPLCSMLNYPDHCVLYRFTPRSLTETDMEIVWFVRGDAVEGKDYDVDKVTWLWHHTTVEDEFIIRRNSEGVNSRFFEPGPYHPEHEETLMRFIAWYLDTLTDDIRQ